MNKAAWTRDGRTMVAEHSDFGGQPIACPIGGEALSTNGTMNSDLKRRRNGEGELESWEHICPNAKRTGCDRVLIFND
jgi:hypothetical protein